MIGMRTSIGDRPHWLLFMGPGGPPQPDGDGGWIISETALDPPGLFGKVAPATAADMERQTAGTVVAQATHLIAIPFHPQVTTQTRVFFTDLHAVEHQFSVVALNNPDMRDADLILTCVEVIP